MDENYIEENNRIDEAGTAALGEETSQIKSADEIMMEFDSAAASDNGVARSFESPANNGGDENSQSTTPLTQNLGSNFDTAFAIAWSQNQGNYSENVAKKIINFAKLQGLKIASALDICCGSANFLNALSEQGIACSGTEILDSYIEYDQQKFPKMNFYKCETLLDFDSLGSFDLITCNHDVINFLPTLDDWGTLFKKVYNHLNDGGLFVFDYYTKRKLNGWNEVIYDENEKLDYIKQIVSNENKTTITNIYYINLDPQLSNQNLHEKQYSLSNHNIRYKRTENSDVEYYFENEDILNLIKHSGYRYLITTDSNFKPISSISDQNRMHVIAIKREK